MNNTKEKITKRFDIQTVIITGGAQEMGATHARGFIGQLPGPIPDPRNGSDI